MSFLCLLMLISCVGHLESEGGLVDVRVAGYQENLRYVIVLKMAMVI